MVREQGEPSAPAPGNAAWDAGAFVERRNAAQARGHLADPPADSLLLGRFTITRALGRRGGGLLYEARDVSADRRVVIRRVALARDPRERRRTIREARALVGLAHANVARVLDVDADADDMLLVMERVEGATLRAWLEAASHEQRRVLDVVLQAARGLAAAHAVGVVHRDFTPDRVLVGEDGRARVVDFGLAPRPAVSETSRRRVPPHAAEDRSTAAPASDAARLVSVAYAAPEQLRGEAPDARSDQFSLCVVLYEALVGAPPFTGDKPAERLASIRRGVARKPPRGLDPRRYRALARGLSFEPRKRWSELGALVEELTRARGRRRRWLLAAAITTLLAVGAVAAAASLGVGEERRAAPPCVDATEPLAGVWDDPRRAAAREALLATRQPYAADSWRAVERRLDARADAWTRERLEACEATVVRGEQPLEVMALRVRCLEERRRELAALVDVLVAADATVVEHAVEAVAASPTLAACRDVVTLRRALPPADPRVAATVASARDELARAAAHARAGQHGSAIERARPILAQADALGYAPLESEARLTLGDALAGHGDHHEAEPLLRAALAGSSRAGQRETAARSAHALLELLGRRAARPDAALELADLARAVVDEADPEGLTAAALQREVAFAKLRAGHLDDAEAGLVAALERLDSIGPRGHLEAAGALVDLGELWTLRGDHEACERSLTRARALLVGELGAEHPVVADVTAAIAASLLRRGEPAKAEELLQVAMMIDARTRGEDHPVSGARLLVHGAALLGLDRRDEARAALERGLAILDAAGATESLARARAHADLGVIARRAGAIEAAIDHHQRAAALFERSLGADDPEVGAQRNALGNLAFARGRNAEARDHYQRALEIKEAALGPDHPGVAGALNNLANAQLELGELAQARALHERALAIFRAQLGERHRLTAHPLTSLAEIAVREQRFADAVTLASRALELREEPDAAKPEERAATRFTLARALWGEGEDPARALALAREAAALLEDVPEGGRAQQSTVRAWLAEREG